MKTVLVIDDDEEVRVALTALLGAAGYAAVTAANGAEALHLIDGGLRPDLLLLDLRMPVMDGPALLAELSRRGEGYPVVVMSGHFDDFSVSHPHPELAKPFAAQELLDTVAEALEAESLRTPPE